MSVLTCCLFPLNSIISRIPLYIHEGNIVGNNNHLQMYQKPQIPKYPPTLNVRISRKLPAVLFTFEIYNTRMDEWVIQPLLYKNPAAYSPLGNVSYKVNETE